MTKPKKKKTLSEEADVYEILKAAMNLPPPPPPSFVHQAFYALPNVIPQGEPWLPDDAETRDYEEVRKHIDRIMDDVYPPFDPQVLTALSPAGIKEYFLPALKVLVYRDGKYFSPQRGAEWKDMELEAYCQSTNIKVTFDGATIEPTGHIAPHEGCDCGIYGSVNIEEIAEWLFKPSEQQRRYMTMGDWDWKEGTYIESKIVVEEPRNVLCIVEPYPGATVHLCRKGWKASKAFISEIVWETISEEGARSLLENAWQREIKMFIKRLVRY